MSTLMLFAALLCTATLATAAPLPAVGSVTLTTEIDTPLDIELYATAQIDGVEDANGDYETEESGTLEVLGSGNFRYTPPAGFIGTDSFDYELCLLGLLCTEHHVEIEVTPIGTLPDPVDPNAVKIGAPADGTAHTSSPSENTIVVSGTTAPSEDVVIYVNGEEVATVTANADGEWTYDLIVDEDDAGELVIAVADEEDNADQVIIELTWDEDGDGGDNGDTTTIEIRGPDDGASLTRSPSENVIVVYGTTDPFKPVKIYVNGEEVATANADGKGAWTYNLNVDEDDAGELSISVSDENENTDEVTVTLVWEEDGENGDNGDSGDGDELLPGKDPDVASAGGRVGSCTSFSATPSSTGLGILSLLVGFAFIRRRQRTRA